MSSHGHRTETTETVQAYSENTAKAYDRIWHGYGATFGDAMMNYLKRIGAPNPGAAVDLGCGTGSLTQVLLANGCRVTAIDSSPHMLARAVAHCTDAIAAGNASFAQCDICQFELTGTVDLAVSCYDTLNHLESLSDLRHCFESVMHALAPNGLFMFDLRTAKGLEAWNRVTITDRDDYALISRGLFAPDIGRAWKKFSGFYAVREGLYERFEEVIFNTAFRIADVANELRTAGFERIHIGVLPNIVQSADNPEGEDRVVFVAHQCAHHDARTASA